MFVTSEVISLFLLAFYNYRPDHKIINSTLKEAFIFVTTILEFANGRVLIQSFGFIYIKESRDPLHGLSRVQYASLLSSV